MAVVMPGLERRLKAELTGEVQFDRFTRGRYATDASHYQIMPVGVVAPRTIEEAERAIAIARSEGVTVLARGGGTSQAGQAVGESLVVDCSKYLDPHSRSRCQGRALHGRAGHRARRSQPRSSSRTACGFRSISRPPRAPPSAAWPAIIPAAAARCATAPCATTCIAIEAVLADGTLGAFRPDRRQTSTTWRRRLRPLAKDLLAIGAREADEVAARFPRCSAASAATISTRSVPGKNDINLAHVLVGSEGTLGFSTRIELKLSPLLGRRAVGACHFGSFREAMDAAQHIVQLLPIAVELIDRTMIELAREIPIFRPTLENSCARRRPRSCWSNSARTITKRICACCGSSRT